MMNEKTIAQSSALLPKERIDSVQLLRAVAAIAVVAHHLPLFGNGAWGVDLFFVISGFIMCYVTEMSGKHFFAKRLIRIVPLYWFGTLSVFCVVSIFPRALTILTTENVTINSVSLLKSLAFIPFQTGDKIQPLLLLGWTLNCEMFFYVLFAAAMKLSHCYRATICSAILFLIVALGQVFPFNAPILKFYSETIFLNFIVGMLCYKIFLSTTTARTQQTAQSKFVWTAIGIGLIALLPVATLHFGTADRFLCWGILSGLAFACMVHGLSRVKIPKFLILVGDASYSLYLFHLYIIAIINKVFKLSVQSGIITYSSGLSASLFAIFVIVLCCWLAVLSYKYIEKPVTEYLRKRLIRE